MKKHYQELQSLFTLDSLLVFAVAYICPRCEIADLCNNIHLPYAIALMNKNTSTSCRPEETEVRCMHTTL